MMLQHDDPVLLKKISFPSSVLLFLQIGRRLLCSNNNGTDDFLQNVLLSHRIVEMLYHRATIKNMFVCPNAADPKNKTDPNIFFCTSGAKIKIQFVCPNATEPKKSRRVKFLFCCKISIFLFYISGFSTCPRVPHKILVLQLISLSRFQQHYKILAGKRSSDTDEIFFDILSIYHYILKPCEIGNGRQLFYTVLVGCSQN